ncbi:hypothetical protein [Flagellimonas meridianipacifica]|uniref:Uncharacterized protein n=1 Tax=Flagellimonas meridianipacifica TaxID=1080225 RepID=A0A2T0MI33_9FLAO|nr:hypothetical protein [Allomuricauda pacifica]PRX57195.1 hypothetical protein CLV81_1198 [Allomuricauda pacifica]
MTNIPSILGCFASGPSVYYDDSQVIKDLAELKGEEFRKYVWGENGIFHSLKILRHKDYGNDLELILFQFYINPIPYLRKNLKEVEPFRKKEKSIGVPIIVDDENFFDKNEEDRYIFLMKSIGDKMDLIEEMVSRKKLDTNISLLRSDLEKIKDKILDF